MGRNIFLTYILLAAIITSLYNTMALVVAIVYAILLMFLTSLWALVSTVFVGLFNYPLLVVCLIPIVFKRDKTTKTSPIYNLLVITFGKNQ